jgi:hypothetical protein
MKVNESFPFQIRGTGNYVCGDEILSTVCCPLNFTSSEDAGIKPRTILTRKKITYLYEADIASYRSVDFKNTSQDDELSL